MQEVWVRLKEFPLYKINNFGEIINDDNGRPVQPSLTRQGALKIGLYEGGDQYTRSVKVLVAETFVHGRSDIFNTPIQLDGNQLNVAADNLMWRPRWFAWKYSKQFPLELDHRDVRHVIDVINGEVYTSVIDVVTSNGLLLTDVWRTIRTRLPIFPTHQVFELAE